MFDDIKHTPDNWILVELGEYHLLVSGWSGGYTTGDSWRISANITHVEIRDDSYVATTYTGSKYRCRMGSEMLRLNTMGIYEQLCKENPRAKQLPMKRYMGGEPRF